MTRFRQHGNPEDLEVAIAQQRHSLALRPEGHPDRILSLEHLASSLFTRYEQGRNWQDLQETITHYEEILWLLPEDHPDRPSFSNKLGVALQAQGHRIQVAIPPPRLHVNPVPFHRLQFFHRLPAMAIILNHVRLRRHNLVHTRGDCDDWQGKSSVSRFRIHPPQTSYELTNHDTNQRSAGGWARGLYSSIGAHCTPFSLSPYKGRNNVFASNNSNHSIANSLIYDFDPNHLFIGRLRELIGLYDIGTVPSVVEAAKPWYLTGKIFTIARHRHRF
ncbi:hypothetical protein FRC02_002518 [Tulasnella sp. 418]|nr:hypothetical protein FRC02_002518 [Tulasnella sp. 418]